jgi:hypothetical protein
MPRHINSAESCEAKIQSKLEVNNVPAPHQNDVVSNANGVDVSTAQPNDSFEAKLYQKLTTGSASTAPIEPTANIQSDEPDTKKDSGDMNRPWVCLKNCTAWEQGKRTRFSRMGMPQGWERASLMPGEQPQAMGTSEHLQKPATQADGPWVCLKCTSENDASAFNCTVCNEEKGKKTRFSIMDIPHAFFDN